MCEFDIFRIIDKVTILLLDASAGWTGLFCPCVLFGRNVEKMREDTPWTHPCMCHAVCIEGGIALAAATAVFHGVDPRTSFLICEGLFFAWWMCGIYTGVLRQELQKKYHLEVIDLLEFITQVSLDSTPHMITFIPQMYIYACCKQPCIFLEVHNQ